MNHVYEDSHELIQTLGYVVDSVANDLIEETGEVPIAEQVVDCVIEAGKTKIVNKIYQAAKDSPADFMKAMSLLHTRDKVFMILENWCAEQCELMFSDELDKHKETNF